MTGWFRRRGCRAHQAALVEFASHRAGGPDVRRALDHVDRCRACEDDLAATTLILHALCRIHEESSRAEIPADGWARLRVRLTTNRRQPSLLMTCLPGIALAVVLVATVAGLPVMRGTQAVLDDGSAVVLRHTSVDDTQLQEPSSAPRAAVRVVARPTVHAQGHPRPPTSMAGPQAVDALAAIGDEPAAVEPAGVPQNGAPPEARTRWR